MLCHERVHLFFYKWVRALLSAVGHDIFRENFRPGIHAYFLYFMFGMFFLSCFYTIATRELMQALAGLSYLCIAWEVCLLFSFKLIFMPKINSIPFAKPNSQLLIKIYSVRYQNEILGMINKIVDIYKQNSNTKAYKRYRMCRRFTLYTEYIFKIGMVLYFVSISTFYLYPLYVYVTENEVAMIVDLYLPGVDESTIAGLVTHIIFHIILTTAAFMGSTSSDFLFTMIIINVPLMANILSENIDELNEIVRVEKHDRHHAKMKFRNILLIHKDITE